MRPFTENSEQPFAIGAARTDLLAEPAPWAARFAEQRAIVCRDIFEPALLAKLLAAAGTTGFRDDHVAGLGTRAVEEPQRVGGTINVLLQRPNLFRWLEAVTGRTGLAGAEGRLVQTRAGGGDALDWHNDLQQARRALGITIGFTDAPFDGGLFELRRVDDPATARCFDHARAGSALIFDLGSDIEHRVHPLSSGGPRRVFTGWFMREAALSAAIA
ncbi:MAG: 2OG-Fe(II) oxygenase [Sphingomonas sp.]|uniref:2OG-Fe(II) oxygenase n=1 Tax=Sphingomonas sp. TaxID=28214 RepID=UPI0011FDA272|nr:2OG-Fe(II) oxygenase [Sphingomonas sp.]THD35884.1 MAG: 2OG-Fe(II) oxygenase [Sphingomonas sp.]